MKFSQMPYERPDIEAITAQAKQTVRKLTDSDSVSEQIAAIDAFQKVMATAGSMSSIAYIRHTIDTTDEIYDRENDYLDEAGPKLEAAEQQVNKAMLTSKFAPALKEHYGQLLFTNIELAVRSFRPEMVPLMQQENRLQSQYQKLYASAVVEFDGKTLTLPQLGPFKQSPDRQTRKKAYEVEGQFFDVHREELDGIYDSLVKNRNAQAKLLGHENYLRLGYDRLGRNCYGQEKVRAFREQIAQDMVPIVAEIKKRQKKRLGVDALRFYDDGLMFKNGNARPKGTAGDILAAGLEMYHGLSPETGEFIDFMYDNGLLDVLSKEGKAPGGYCTEIFDYQAPFIFSNFNGTSADVDVLTHEAGHAFAGYRAMRKGYIQPLVSPTVEACECHSMSMEFLTAGFHDRFFAEATKKYEVGHCEDALVFIPYGCMVDEFQHIMYQRPELTADGRNAVWLELEKKYRPWIDFDKLPFYSRGAGWQRQLHIFLYPLYYIDYCMAQTVAFQFWLASQEDFVDAWKRYLAFVDKGGTETFEQLVGEAGLKLPYEPGCIREIGNKIAGWLTANALE